jgi:membrane associated rhomboid family serine protease
LIPIRDANPSLRPPLVTWALIGIGIYVFFGVQPREGDPAYFYETAAIPCEVVTGMPLDEVEIRRDVCSNQPLGPIPFPDKDIPLSVGWSLVLHASVLHLLGNLWFLWIFGDNVEDAMGRLGYAIFFVLAGVVATLSYVVFNADSTIPLIGASGAIGGVMGAYLVLFPRARVVSVFPLLFFIPVALPAFVFLGFWFASQFFLFGAATQIAWQAHVGGFLFGVAVAAVLRAPLRRRVAVKRIRLPG